MSTRSVTDGFSGTFQSTFGLKFSPAALAACRIVVQIPRGCVQLLLVRKYRKENSSPSLVTWDLVMSPGCCVPQIDIVHNWNMTKDPQCYVPQLRVRGLRTLLGPEEHMRPFFIGATLLHIAVLFKDSSPRGFCISQSPCA